jgi:hypothetical protein
MFAHGTLGRPHLGDQQCEHRLDRLDSTLVGPTISVTSRTSIRRWVNSYGVITALASLGAIRAIVLTRAYPESYGLTSGLDCNIMQHTSVYYQRLQSGEGNQCQFASGLG